jgi:hypothetical protein
MKKAYGAFISRGAQLSLSSERIPAGLREIAHCASFWGIPGDTERDSLVASAPPEVLGNLKRVVEAYDDDLDDWLAGEEADRPGPSPEYVAYSNMRLAADDASDDDDDDD